MTTTRLSRAIFPILVFFSLCGCQPDSESDNDGGSPADDDGASPPDDDDETQSDDDNDDDATPPGEEIELYGTLSLYEPDDDAANYSCLIRHFDGSAWDDTEFDDCGLFSIWGMGDHQVVAVGWNQRPGEVFAHPFSLSLGSDGWAQVRDPRPATGFYAVSGAPGAGFYAAGSTDYIKHGLWRHDWLVDRLVGESWDEAAQGGWIGVWTELWGIWVASTGEAFAVGDNDYGYLIVQNDHGWWRKTVGYYDIRSLGGVWGAARDDVFAVGGATDGMEAKSSLILHYDGREWAEMDSGNGLPFGLWAVMGSSGTDVYAVGGDMLQGGIGVVLHYDGEKWEDTYAPVESKADSLWVAGPSSVYVPYGHAGIIHYDGREWTLFSVANVHYLTGFVRSKDEAQ